MGRGENTRFALLLQRVFGVRGHLEADVEDAIAPVYPVGDASAPENILARGEVLGDTTIAQVAVVGAFSRVAVVNTAGSSRLVVVDRIAVRTPAGAATIAMTPAGEPTPLSTRFGVAADTRRVPVTCQTFAAAYTSVAAIPVAQQSIVRTAGATWTELLGVGGFVLAPGWALIIEHGTANAELHGSFRFRERQVTGEELRERA